ncbi:MULTISPECIES: NgoMIV family type II restriction endonuclease [unclassified Streptomyces]|uniref:NgoMIV family type II restriction endonuclease n=1 Tax=unclassified Streptomyces TaxID=2593676 RepID=UPI002E2B8F38|nr:NgoMIV family type II restriction endonuclease [Streptomyces sp. NBC_01429]
MTNNLCENVPEWLPELFAWKPPTPKSLDTVRRALHRDRVPNIADGSQRASLVISGSIFDRLQIERVVSEDSEKADEESLGKLLEISVADDLAKTLSARSPGIPWKVHRNRKIWDFSQYSHIKDLKDAAAKYPDIEAIIGGDYLIDPDVTIGVPGRYGNSLRAVISCKWTIRSDRAQNVRHEFNSLIRARRGRAPHLIAVTAEPLPSRLSSLTQGMGEIDSVYHVAFELMKEAVRDFEPLRLRKGEPSQADHWNNMVKLGRLRDYRELADDILSD